MLFQQSASGSSESANTTEDDYEVVGTVNDRSTLSDEMAAMCAKFPIYRIKRRKVTMSVEKENIQGICVLLFIFRLIVLSGTAKELMPTELIISRN